MKHHELPRVLRRAVGLMRFARESVDASAASMFLLDDAGRTLHGIVSEWDWTRTSFATDISEWPSIARALADGVPRSISAEAALGAEADWFGARGITRTVCVPLRDDELTLGVLFFDFDDRAGRLGHADAALLADVGRRCVRAFARARAMPSRVEAAPLS